MIRSTLHAIDDRRFMCSDCLGSFSGRKDAEKMVESARRLKHCQTMSETVVHTIDRELNFKTCIGNFVSPLVYALLDLHKAYEQGVLPYAGSLMEQPYKIVEIFRIIEAHKHAKMKAEAEKAKKPQPVRTRGRK